MISKGGANVRPTARVRGSPLYSKSLFVHILNSYFVNGKINSNIVYENLPKCTFQMSTNGIDQLVPLVVGTKNEVMAFKYSTLNSNIIDNNIHICILFHNICSIYNI